MESLYQKTLGENDDLPYLLMDMARMIGCQPDFRTSLVGGEFVAIITHAGMRSRKMLHITEGRYHMSKEQHSGG